MALLPRMMTKTFPAAWVKKVKSDDDVKWVMKVEELDIRWIPRLNHKSFF